MTTEALRKVIKVTDWNLNPTGLTISYVREDHSPKLLHLIIDPADTLMELFAVGSVEEVNLNIDPHAALIEDCWHPFPAFVFNYKMCQWEALSIAIRHEEEKELANDMNMLELDAAINALK